MTWTGKVSISLLPEVATTVESVPWVMTTTRGRAEFFLGRAARALAISGISWV